MNTNNETIAISTEVAIAKTFNIEIDQNYILRSNQDIVNFLLKNNSILTIFQKENIPFPIKHTALKQNPIDFKLERNKTLSVKTNHTKLGKVSPQNIGQPTCETYFKYLENYFNNKFNLKILLQNEKLCDNYENRAYIFKKLTLQYIDILINMYWNNLFDCDYYLHIFNIENFKDPKNNYIVLKKQQPPLWDKNKFSFTKSLRDWNESNTLKYNGISIGEFQVHKNRNCLKFRFNMKGIIDLYSKNLI